MKAQVSSMDPEAIRAAVEMSKQADSAALKEQFKNEGIGSVDTMKGQMNALNSHVLSENEKKVQQSEEWKNEANALYMKEKWQEARDVYIKAKKNLNGLSSLEARKLHRTCMLNEYA